MATKRAVVGSSAVSAPGLMAVFGITMIAQHASKVYNYFNDCQFSEIKISSNDSIRIPLR